MTNAPRRRAGNKTFATYARFREVDGQHAFKQAVPHAYVDYPARRRHDGQVAYFNFELAKEMGLIPLDHPERLNAELRKAIRNNSRRRAPRGYEERLRRYFDSMD